MSHAERHPDTPDRDRDQGDGGARWFAARLKPSGFVPAHRHLRRQGFDVFAPLRTREIRHARQARRVRRPLFPGYLFVGFDPAVTAWRVINSTFGVARLVMARENLPLPAPVGLVESLRERCDAAGVLLPPPQLAPGDRVRILAGPFADLVATVERLSDSERVQLLLELMGRQARLHARRRDLEITVGA
ncbi:MAG: transcription termination/antitermination protein NusG [Paracoccaceae bacterium]